MKKKNTFVDSDLTPVSRNLSVESVDSLPSLEEIENFGLGRYYVSPHHLVFSIVALKVH